MFNTPPPGSFPGPPPFFAAILPLFFLPHPAPFPIPSPIPCIVHKLVHIRSHQGKEKEEIPNKRNVLMEKIIAILSVYSGIDSRVQIMELGK